MSNKSENRISQEKLRGGIRIGLVHRLGVINCCPGRIMESQRDSCLGLWRGRCGVMSPSFDGSLSVSVFSFDLEGPPALSERISNSIDSFIRPLMKDLSDDMVSGVVVYLLIFIRE